MDGIDSIDESKQKSSPQSWDDSDDKLLIQLKEVQHLGWKQIAKYFNNRTSNACQFRWRRLKSGQLKKVSKSKLYARQHQQSDDHQLSNDLSGTSINSSDLTEQQLVNKIPSFKNRWTIEEDNLIRSRISKKLSVVELSILLPNKSTSSIEERIAFLERKKLTISSLLSSEDPNGDSGSNVLISTRGTSLPTLQKQDLPQISQPMGPQFYSNNNPYFNQPFNPHFNQHYNQNLIPITASVAATVVTPINNHSRYGESYNYYVHPTLPQQPSRQITLPSLSQSSIYPVGYSSNDFNDEGKLPPLSKVYSILNQ